MSANFAQLQLDCFHKLLSEPLLTDLNIKSVRDLQAMQIGEGDDPQTLVDAFMVWTTPREGGTKTGAGALVSLPTRSYRVPNVPGPERECVVTVTTFEDPTLNRYGSNTTGKTCEEWSDLIEAILHQWAEEQMGILWIKASKPNRDIQGIVAYDTEIVCEIARASIEAVQVPAFSCPVLTVTLANVTSGASIYYTTDGSFPGSGNSAATLYSAPFVVTSGTTVRWAAYKTALRGSDVGHATVT